MNLHKSDYAVLRAIAVAGSCTRRSVGASKAAVNRLRSAGLIEVHIEATHGDFEGEGDARRAVNPRKGQLIAHRWRVTEDGKLLSGTMGWSLPHEEVDA